MLYKILRTWDDLCEAASDNENRHVVAKDNAREFFRALFQEEYGRDIEDDESPEESIDVFVANNPASQFLFDWQGHFAGTFIVPTKFLIPTKLDAWTSSH